MEEMRFDGRVAIVTGGGRGLGRAYALALAGRGAKVVVNDLGIASSLGTGDVHADVAAAVVDEIIASGGDAVASSDDVTVESGAASIVASAIDAFGSVDVVVNNAGISIPDDMPGLSREQFGQHLDVHVIGSYNVTRAAWPHMVSRGYGRVVLTGSLGTLGGPFLLAYSAAKGALWPLGRSLALAGAEHGIKVNLVSPAADTRMVTDADVRAAYDIPPLDPGAGEDPRRSPQLVAPMVLLLAHELCPVSGELLVAGLGRFARMFHAETRGIVDVGITPEGILARWSEVVDETGYLVHASTRDAVNFREALIEEALQQR